MCLKIGNMKFGIDQINNAAPGWLVRLNTSLVTLFTTAGPFIATQVPESMMSDHAKVMAAVYIGFGLLILRFIENLTGIQSPNSTNNQNQPSNDTETTAK